MKIMAQRSSKCEKSIWLIGNRGWREGGGIEPPSRRSTAQTHGFEARRAHQGHMPPIWRGILYPNMGKSFRARLCPMLCVALWLF